MISRAGTLDLKTKTVIRDKKKKALYKMTKGSNQQDDYST